MQSQTEHTFEAMMRPAREMFEQWVSFFPVAPLYGVRWRFAADVAEVMLPTDIREAPPTSADAVDTLEEATVCDKVTPVATAPASVEIAPEVDPVPAPAAAAVPPASDDLQRIRGIGPRLAAELNALGIDRFAQIAALTPGELARIDAALTTVKGRCYRDDWVGQARTLTGETLAQ